MTSCLACWQLLLWKEWNSAKYVHLLIAEYASYYESSSFSQLHVFKCISTFVIDVLFLASGIEMFKQTLEESHAGDQLGALLRGVKRDEVRRGMMLCQPGTAHAHDYVDAQVPFWKSLIWCAIQCSSLKQKRFSSYIFLTIYILKLQKHFLLGLPCLNIKFWYYPLLSRVRGRIGS